jgi:hypothetical protein
MSDGRAGRAAALTELREKLSDGLASSRLTKTDLAARTDLGRTTVQEAFQTNGPVPSAQTVAALARALRLPVQEMRELRRIAAGETAPAAETERGLGKPISEWDPHDLEVHPAGPAVTVELPGYVPRAHDQDLADAVLDAAAGRSRMVVLVGSSSTGKTRACWEAIQPLATQGWWLWHPFDPTRAEAALADLQRVRSRTVVWLNEAQHYLDDSQEGERIAAAVHVLLTDPGRGPILVLGTLWPEYVEQYTALSLPGKVDPHSQVRELLAGRLITVAESFDEEALRMAAALADNGDRLLADALTRAGNGRVTQELAGAPELLRRYQYGTPAVRAVLEAAMDARRLGVGLYLPHAFLINAAIDYLSDHDYDELTEDWAESAFASLARPVHGKQAPLRRIATRPKRRPPGSPALSNALLPATGPMFRLADSLEQHGRATRRRLCPPASFWDAAYSHLIHPGELNRLADAARARWRLQWEHHLRHRAADVGSGDALLVLAWKRVEAGDREGAEALYRQAANAGNTYGLVHLARMREEAGDREGAEALAWEAANAGIPHAPVHLARVRVEAGDREGAEALYRQAAEAGNTDALVDVAWNREEAGDREGAEVLYRQAADAGNTSAWLHLRRLQRGAGDLEEWRDKDKTDALARQAAEAGDTFGLFLLAKMRKEAGDAEGSEALHWQAAEAGDSFGLVHVARMRVEAGDREGAEALYRQAANAGNAYGLVELARMRVEAGDREGAEALYRQAANAGETDAHVELARMRVETGGREGAEALYRQVVDAGDISVLLELARKRVNNENQKGAEGLNRQAPDISDGFPFDPAIAWPYGLDPDGMPTPPWQ